MTVTIITTAQLHSYNMRSFPLKLIANSSLCGHKFKKVINVDRALVQIKNCKENKKHNSLAINIRDVCICEVERCHFFTAKAYVVYL